MKGAKQFALFLFCVYKIAILSGFVSGNTFCTTIENIFRIRSDCAGYNSN